MKNNRILAIETSCDETAAAVIGDGTQVLGNAVASSTAMHAKYGGIVPEVAAREQLKCIIPTIEECLHQAKLTIEDIDSIAVTVGPGLIGSLLIGVETAKTIALTTQKPVIPVNHVLAHMYANFVDAKPVEFPAISMVVSGGHTELFLMESAGKLTWLGGTLDDAAGEAFDKTARLLGFGNGGGVAIQNAAKAFNPGRSTEKIKFPRPILHDDTLNFSFSGLKTAILREVNMLKQNQKLTDDMIAHLAFEVQESITDVLVAKTMRAAARYQVKSVLLSGGVAANLRLREKFLERMENAGRPLAFHVPPVSLCTDNAVYIGVYAYMRGEPADWHSITAIPDLSVENMETL